MHISYYNALVHTVQKDLHPLRSDLLCTHGTANAE